MTGQSLPFHDTSKLASGAFWRLDAPHTARRAAAAPTQASMSVTRSGDLEARLSSLMTAAQNGDRDAYRDLLRECVPMIRSVAGRRVAADRVDDVVQDVLLTLHRSRHTYDPSRPFLAWLRAIADRRAIDLLRSVARRNAREVHAPASYDLQIDPALSADRLIEKRQDASSVRDAVAGLPANQRAAIENIVFKERSLKETSMLTGKSEGAIKVSLHRALKALRLRFLRGMDADNV
jgi:RNA polymerase sigma-70 factor (ECF subfamily)